MAIRTFRGGVHPLHHANHGKYTRGKAISELAAPDEVAIPMARATGAVLEPLVKKGDAVKMGQKIGDSQAFVSAPVHASVSGTVKAVEMRAHPGGQQSLCVVIENDHLDTLDDSVTPCADYAGKSRQELLDIVREKGVVGMGGATFPTHVKLNIPPGKTVDTLIANGAECEPYLTADHRLMLEEPARIVEGMQVAMHILGVQKAFIGIENNKSDAIETMRAACAADPRIQVSPLKVKYPQGSEKQLITAILKRSVPSGGLPADVGCVVSNTGSLAALRDAVIDGMPLIRRVVTVSGSGINEPANLLVRIGTSFRACVEACGGVNTQSGKIINGGPMMGVAVHTLDVPVIAGTSGILVLGEQEARIPPESACIRCGRCVEVCPIRLLPVTIAEAVDRQDFQSAARYKTMDCVECGSCVYACPAMRNMLQKIRLAKRTIREQGIK